MRTISEGSLFPGTNCCWVKPLQVVNCMGVGLSVEERVHVTGKWLGFLNILVFVLVMYR